MTADHDTTRAVRAWLRKEGFESGDRLLAAILDEVASTPQRRRTLWRREVDSRMHPLVTMAVGAAAAMLAVVIGLGALRVDMGSLPFPDDRGPATTPTPSVLAHVDDVRGPLGAGRYAFDVVDAPTVRVTMDVVEGMVPFDRFAVMGPNGADPPAGYGIGFWTAHNVYVDPLDYEAGVLDPPLGPHVGDLVEALVEHDGWTTSVPEPTVVDGYPGQALNLTVPSDVEFDTAGCGNGEGPDRPF
jgi:hypothetical protein